MEDCTYYEDGKFADNKVFAFYVLNYVNRHTNSIQGSYYVKKFNKDFDCLKYLQATVGHNDFKWINVETVLLFGIVSYFRVVQALVDLPLR